MKLRYRTPVKTYYLKFLFFRLTYPNLLYLVSGALHLAHSIDYLKLEGGAEKLAQKRVKSKNLINNLNFRIKNFRSKFDILLFNLFLRNTIKISDFDPGT